MTFQYHPGPRREAFSTFFGGGYPYVEGSTDDDLLGLLAETDGAGSSQTEPDGEWPAAARATAAIHDGGAACRAGHGFVIDCGEGLSYEQLAWLAPREILGVAEVPFAVTPVVAAIHGLPMLFTMVADERGRLAEVTVASLTGLPGWHAFAMLAWVRLLPDGDGVPAPVFDRDAGVDAIACVHTLLGVTRALLVLIGDERLPVASRRPSAGFNRKRVRRGLPAVPAAWRLDASRASGLYAAKPDATRIGEVLRRMTRQRAFYETKLNKGENR